jgi:hypothetical protein
MERARWVTLVTPHVKDVAISGFHQHGCANCHTRSPATTSLLHYATHGGSLLLAQAAGQRASCQVTEAPRMPKTIQSSIIASYTFVMLRQSPFTYNRLKTKFLSKAVSLPTVQRQAFLRTATSLIRPKDPTKSVLSMD